MIRAVFTCGDINGIGPEIAVKAFSRNIKKVINQSDYFHLSQKCI
jgi:4-hydroxy-L-threonine phosphate dehydrogenase PdxA